MNTTPEKKSSSGGLTANDKNMIACFFITALVIGLYFIPNGWYVLYPFMLIYTFVHEMGHGIAALIVGGEFDKFVMWPDGSGTAFSRLIDPTRFSRAFVAFGGLIAPAIMAAICLILGRSGKSSRIGLYVFAALSALSLILVVRNLFGIFFVAACGLVSFALAKLPKSNIIPQYSMLILAITLLTSVFSRGDYLFTDTAQTATGPMPSDVGQIAENLFLPYWFWGALIAALSVLILFIGIRAFFHTSKPKSSDKHSKKQISEETI